MSFQGQINFGYPITSHNIITDVPDNAVLPLSIGSSLQGNILGITFGDLKSQVTPSFDNNFNVPYGPNTLANINSSAAYNTAIGFSSMADGNGGQANTALGYLTLRNNISDNNTAVGYSALSVNTNGNDNTAVGYNSLVTNQTGSKNTALGGFSLHHSVSSIENTAIGYGSGYNITTGRNNTTLGNLSGYNITTGRWNIAIGDNSGGITTGDGNITIGWYAAGSLYGGVNNVIIGSQAVCNDGSSNVVLGYLASSAQWSNCVVLGRGATATNSNQFVVGSVTTNAGSIVTAAQTQTKYWNVIINGVAQRILLA